MKLTNRQLIFIAIFCLTLLGITCWIIFVEYDRPWKKYQQGFAQLQYDIAPGRKFERSEKSIKQLWLKDFAETDRCTTCHPGADKPGFENAPQPYKTHSGDYLKHHPVEQYGCVICHEGQGAALTVEAAHGEAGNWPRPVLTGALAQSSCGKCHFMGQALPSDSAIAGAEIYSEGWRLFQEYNCIGCHKLKGDKRPEYIGPPLASIGSKVNKDWLVGWLKNPEGYLPETRMPRFNITDEEIEYIAEYLLSLKTVLRRGTPRRAPADNNGEKLVESLGCLGCHTINNKGNAFAPDLSDIGNKVNQDWLFQWLKKPGEFNSKTRMPDVMLSETEAGNVTAYLMTLKHPHPNPPPSRGRGSDGRYLSEEVNQYGKLKIKYSPSPGGRGSGGGGSLANEIEKGRKLVKAFGCTGCHEIGSLIFQYDAPELSGMGDKRIDELFFGNMTADEKDLISWLRIKVTDPGRFNTDKMAVRMPVYKFSGKQAEALVVFLLSLRKDYVPPKYIRNMFDPDRAGIRGKKVFEKHNCSGCHPLNKAGGNIAPDLTDAGKKARSEWLFSFLERPHKIRPFQILKARMPDFKLSSKDINDVIEYLYFISGEPYPFDSEPKREIPPEDVFDGEKLYQEVFACSSCHTVGGQGGEIGPDNTDLASRLKREWLERWMRDPQAIKPDVRMPKFKFEDWEFTALTNYLMTMGKYRFVQVRNSD
ncbi:MAG: c-type cytochrome [Nitrospirota bacterium]